MMQCRILHRSAYYRAGFSRGFHGTESVSSLPALKSRRYPENEADTNQVNDIAANRFTFLNKSVELGNPPDWHSGEQDQLWRYNLHYFHYAVTLANAFEHNGDTRCYAVFRRLVHEWIRQCPVATPVAWDAYPVSLRITNWIKAYSVFARCLQDDEEFATELRRSLYTQARFLERHIEYHLLGNHLIENGRALLLAGLFFTDPAHERSSTRWLNKGKKILWHEIQEQYLEDGGHFERSPMYHHLYLNLYREVTGLLQAKGHNVPEYVPEKLQAMERWLATVLHPDGNIPLLNDATFGMVNQLPDVDAKWVNDSQYLHCLPDSGYYVFRDSAAGNYLIFDCGPLGPDYFPSHGHCDALSYELSICGRRIIVDSGVDTYDGERQKRLYYRSTRAHNTVVVDKTEQSEIWDRYRVGRRARPLNVHHGEQGAEIAWVVGAHSGYHRLPGKITHRRWMCWVDQRFWIVCDSIIGTGHHQLESLIHFSPDVSVIHGLSGPDDVGEVTNGESTLQVLPWGFQSSASFSGEQDPVQGWIASDFGLEEPNTVWCLAAEGELPMWLGYVLWPSVDSVSLSVENGDAGKCQVTLDSANCTYRILFTEGDGQGGYDPVLLRPCV